jgi:hypothetical protein
MADFTHTKIADIEAIDGVLEGISFHKAAAGLDVSAFGISIIDLAPGAGDYPEHDHSEQGLGGRMFAKRPQQLGQEEVYAALKRKVTPGPDGLRLLVIGATPGEPYETGGAL